MILRKMICLRLKLLPIAGHLANVVENFDKLFLIKIDK